MTYEVYMPGTSVHVRGDDDLIGTVVGFTVRDAGVTSYEVAWWSGAERKCEFLTPCEVRGASTNRPRKVGFCAVKPREGE